MLNKNKKFTLKKQTKKIIQKQIFEYKTIDGVPNKYLDYLLVKSTNEKILREFYGKEKEIPAVKAIKLKHKISKSLVSLEMDKLKAVSVDYIEFDKSKNLYSYISGITVRMLQDFLNTQGFDIENMTKEEFIENVQKIINKVDICNLVSYIRLKRDDLHDFVPWLLAKWEDSEDFELSDILDTYGFDSKSVNLEAFDIDIDFEICEIPENMENQKLLNLEESTLFNKDNIKTTIYIMKECIDFLGKKVEENEDSDRKTKELEKLINENKKLTAKLEKKLKAAQIRESELKTENEELNKKLETANKKLEKLEEANKQHKEKIEELKKEKREINKQNKLNIEELDNVKNNLKLKIEEIELMRENKIEINNIKENYQKSLEDVENSKNQCIELQCQLYALKKEKEEICNMYENKVKQLIEELQSTNKLDTSKIKSQDNKIKDNEPKDINPIIDEENLDDFDDFGDLFGDELDNNPTYSSF